MTTIFEHESKNRQVLTYSSSRLTEIDKTIKELQLERGVLLAIIDNFKMAVCTNCCGLGYSMEYETGCEHDGPRMKTCPECEGTGGRQDEQE